jgi:hypothetical protein
MSKDEAVKIDGSKATDEQLTAMLEAWGATVEGDDTGYEVQYAANPNDPHDGKVHTMRLDSEDHSEALYEAWTIVKPEVAK